MTVTYLFYAGSGERENVPRDEWPALLDQAEADPEHGAMMVSLPRGLTIEADYLGERPSVAMSGREFDDEIGTAGYYYMEGVSREDILALWELLAEDRIDEIRSRPWIAFVNRG